MRAGMILRRRSLPGRLLHAPLLFVRMYRIVHPLGVLARLRFASWQTWLLVRGF